MTRISLSVEISIAGGVENMVREPIPGLVLFLFLFLFLFLYHVFIVTVQELACSTSNKNYKIISKSYQVLDISPSHS